VVPIAGETDTFLILDDGRSVGIDFPSQLVQVGKEYVCALGEHGSLHEVSFAGDA
jgi:hypothetical protein